MTHPIQVWWVDPAIASKTQLCGFEALLDRHERAAAARLLRPVDRIRYVLSHALLRRVLSDVVRIPPADLVFDRTCVRCAAIDQPNQHGKPRLVNARCQFSLSRAGSLVLVATTMDLEIGIDGEEVGATDFTGFDDVALSRLERREIDQMPSSQRDRGRAQLWARKEAVLKASGWGLAMDPTLILVGSPRQATGAVTTSPGRYQLADLDVGPVHAASVAVETGSTIDVRVQDAAEVLAH